MGYADVEKLLVGWLPTVIPPTAPATSQRVVTETPSTLAQILPVVQVTRVGGNSSHRLDSATVVVDCYAKDRGSAAALADQVRVQFEDNLSGYRNAEGVVAQVETVSAPSWAPYDDTTLRRFTAAYRITVHSLT